MCPGRPRFHTETRICMPLIANCSGKSSLLKALTSRLANQRAMTGAVHYCGLTVAEAQARGIAVNQLVEYVSQLDEHSALLTVREVSPRRQSWIGIAGSSAGSCPRACSYAAPQTLAFVARNNFSDAAQASARVQEVLDLLHLNGTHQMHIDSRLYRRP